MDVLLVEDDDAIAAGVRDGLQDAGMRVRRVSRGADALVAVTEPSAPDIVLLDLGLPDMDGTDVCRGLRARSTVPVIVVSARADEIDRVVALEMGADDYVVKPFGMRELVARIRAVTRRAGSSAPDGPEQNGNGSAPQRIGRLVIDRRTQRVYVDDSEVELTAKEFDLLSYLATDPGAICRRSDIVEHVWDANWFGPTKTVDAHVASLRKKLGDHGWIVAVRGVGFRLEEPG